MHMPTTIPADWPTSLSRTLYRLATAQPVVTRSGAVTPADDPAAADAGSVIRSIEPLSGMSGSSVHRVVLAADADAPTRTVIVKRCASGVEPAFYRSIAPLLETFGLGIPRLLAGIAVNVHPGVDAAPDPTVAAASAAQWLVLEAIPYPLSTMDPDDLRAPLAQYLARLHAVTRYLLPDAQAAAQALPETAHAWNDAHTTTALAALAATNDDLPLVLAQLQQAAQPVFEPWCRVSGDTNPRNWGMREDGSLVLFDWEQTGRATPAYDLGSTLPGLPDLAAVRLLTDDYLAAWQHLPHDPAIRPLPWDADELALLALLARAATLVHLLAEMDDPTSGAEIPTDLQTVLRSAAPDWLRQTARELNLTTN